MGGVHRTLVRFAGSQCDTRSVARAKRHHYLPQFHQRLFGVGLEGGSIWRYDKTSDSIRLLPIKDTGVIGNYYTVQTKAGPDDGLERIFAQVEGAAAPVINRLCAEPGPRFQVDVGSRFALGTYLGLLHGRVPGTRQKMKQLFEWTKAVEIDLRLADADRYLEEARAAGDTRAPETVEAARVEMLAAMREGSLRVEAAESVSLDATIMGMRDVAPYIAAMGWWLVKRSTFPRYVLGDAPVTRVARQHPPFRGAGFATPTAETAVPLDPETMLVMGHNMPDGYIIHEEGLREPVFGAWRWPYQYRQWSRADRFFTRGAAPTLRPSSSP